jgi:hypothetical protein
MNNQIFTRLMVLFFAAGALVMLQGMASRQTPNQQRLNPLSNQTSQLDPVTQSNSTAYRGSGRIAADTAL